tara:strand:+ start:15640 stop:16335 length:696 start_codon:yes stop_codon:yes gene_type:complete
MGSYLIIGGSSGIGKALVGLLSEANHSVYSTYHNTHVVNSVKTIYQPLNVLSNDINLDGLPEQLDGLVYCPGRINLKPFKRFSAEDFLDDFNLQVVGATKVIQHVMPRLLKSDSASIVLFSTVAVQSGFSFHSQVSASKGAIEGLTRSLAAEFAPKIRVNAVAPSLTDTPLASKFLNTSQKIEAQSAKNPLNKIGEPQDIANMVEFLLSSKASWVTGQIMHIDGGFSTIKQ